MSSVRICKNLGEMNNDFTSQQTAMNCTAHRKEQTRSTSRLSSQQKHINRTTNCEVKKIIFLADFHKNYMIRDMNRYI